MSAAQSRFLPVATHRFYWLLPFQGTRFFRTCAHNVGLLKLGRRNEHLADALFSGNQFSRNHSAPTNPHGDTGTSEDFRP